MFNKATEIDYDFAETMVKARVYLGLATTMFSYMAYRCNIVPTDDERVPTAAATVRASGNYVYINVHFWKELADKERAFVLLHEIQHIFLDHIERARDGMYHATLWNIATDYNINLTSSGTYSKLDWNNKPQIHKNDRYTKYLVMPDGGLYDEKYIDMSSDEIYSQLLEEADGDAEQACKNVLGEDGYEEYEVTMIDIRPSDEAGNTVRAEEIEAQRIKNRQTAIEAVQNAEMSGGIGDNEASLARLFSDLVKPRIDWTEHIANSFVKNSQERTTYKRYNNKSMGGVIFPSWEGHTINVVFGIDTSGSMSDNDLNRAVSEFSNLLKTYDSWTVHLLTCDVKPHVIGIYSSEDGDSFETVDKSLIGGGGTEMQPIVDYAKEQLEDINTCIILTDGGLGYEDLQDVDVDFGVVVVVTENGNKSYENDKVEVVHID